MRTLIVYASTEGQTRKIARFLADALVDLGHPVELLSAEDTEGLVLNRFDAALLLASLHMGRYQSVLADFIKENRDALAELKTAFLPVSLAVLSKEEKEQKELADIATKFVEETGFTPGETMHVAGALRFTEYDFFKSWAMRYISSHYFEDLDPHKDHEFTDWDALAAFSKRFAD